MHFFARQVASSPADPDRDDLAYVHVRGEDGYIFSLARFPESEFVEVMVRDQQNIRTTLVSAKLTAHQLVVEVPQAVAQDLDGHATYKVAFDPGRHAELHQALSVIFAGVGVYENAL